jgi:inner membrane protein
MPEEQSRSFEVVYENDNKQNTPIIQASPYSQSLTVRSLLVILLMLLMLFPLYMVDKVVKQRAQYFQSVVSDVASSWGDNQTVIGPVLAVPYKEHITSVETVNDGNGAAKTVSRDIFNDKTMIILPEELVIKGTLNEAHHKRGIYDTEVYKADLEISGHFNLNALPRKGSRYIIKWDKAWLAMGLSDTKAVKKTSPLYWEDSTSIFKPGTRMTGILKNGFHASMKNIPKGETNPKFKIKLNFNGSEQFRFAPLGINTATHLESNWKHSDFKSDIAPQSNTVSNSGFDADWNIPHLTRNYPQSWLLDQGDFKLDDVTAGVNMVTSTSRYSKVSAAIKYGALFIALAFLSFLIFEVTVQRRVHIIQYGVVGLCLTLFYILLVALSEHLPFTQAYLYSAGTTVGIITLYSFALLRSFIKGLFVLILLGSLYAALYYILEMQDYALLVGAAVMLFVVLLLMLATWNIKEQQS